MRKILCIIGLGILAIPATAQTYSERVKAYIDQYAAWAMEEQQRVGIPASITLAQGVHETAAGESELAKNANNHFGIKCKKEWQGMTYAYTDDAPNECFRKYTSAKESYIDHSDYLKNSKRYAELFTYHVNDYQSWAKGLKRCGYATNPAYAQKLIKLIDDYGLHEYTLNAKNNGISKSVTTQVVAKPSEVLAVSNSKPETEVSFNNLRAVYATKGQSLLDVATSQNIRYAKLLEYNELKDGLLEQDQYLYLEPRRSKGSHVTYQVQKGETVEYIAYKEGMYSKNLRVLNLMAANEQPEEGSVLQLQYQSEVRPRVYVMDAESSKYVQQTKPVKLVNTQKATALSDDYLPTQRAKTNTNTDSQSEEHLEMGFGVVPPKRTVAQTTEQPSQLFEENTAEQQRAKKEVSAVPTEPAKELDEVEALKAKLDKVVYARTTKSGTKVTSTDESSIYKNVTASEASQEKVAAKTSATPADANATYHVVQKGDTGYSIAKKYGISMKQLNEWNGLNFDAIKIGQKLRVK